jgi:hypothetical protein
MSSDRPVRVPVSVALATFALAAHLGTAACVSIDKYPPSTRFDAGTLDSSSDLNLPPEGGTEACTTCLQSQCQSEWAACESEADCASCLVDPLSDACKASMSRRPARNCGCVPSTCLKACPSLCFVVPPTTGTIAGECIACTAERCGQFVSACIADSVCFACLTDSQNPRCPANGPWAATTACLCTTPNTCFDECTCLPMPE